MKPSHLLVCTAFAAFSSLPLLAQSGWGTTDVRYAFRDKATVDTKRALSLKGWKGEVVHGQMVVQNNTTQENFYTLRPAALRGPKGGKIPASAISLGWVDEVLTDSFKGCGLHDLEANGRRKVADRIVQKSHFLLPQGEQRGVWYSIAIPRGIPAGTYKGEISVVTQDKKEQRLAVSVTVNERVLPEAKDWKFHLDFWQNPYAVARWHNVPLWSKEHFDALRPLMRLLARSGQKVVTATLINRPWNGQTQDPFGSMITWKKTADGAWSYDYTIFDRWVEFMQECGIDEEITCFSMIPWQLSFEYFDEATQSLQNWKGAPGEEIYTERWGHFLAAFAAHLKEKGWFSKTAIAMDERSNEQMQRAIALIHKAAPGLKISMAGNYHKEIANDLWDYCIDEQSADQFSADEIVERRKAGKISTYYTCCSSLFPNTFTFSPTAEAAFIPLYALSRNLDGYLRWAYNSWTIDPEYDSRFRAWPGGDTYIVYPEANSSLRWERLLEGIQLFEKFHLLRDEAVRQNDTARLQRLNDALRKIDISRITTEVNQMVAEMSETLNAL